MNQKNLVRLALKDDIEGEKLLICCVRVLLTAAEIVSCWFNA